MNDRQSPPPRPTTLVARVKAYYGFAEPGLTFRERCAIFQENERRSWARLLGSRRPEDACISRLPPAAD
ncbi:MAG: hypothetical protein OES32_04230 [Acidobacteriota bacterium]|nr:hypothetical protein [Acidobacteriota bacterium]